MGLFNCRRGQARSFSVSVLAHPKAGQMFDNKIAKLVKQKILRTGNVREPTKFWQFERGKGTKWAKRRREKRTGRDVDSHIAIPFSVTT